MCCSPRFNDKAILLVRPHDPGVTPRRTQDSVLNLVVEFGRYCTLPKQMATEARSHGAADDRPEIVHENDTFVRAVFNTGISDSLSTGGSDSVWLGSKAGMMVPALL